MEGSGGEQLPKNIKRSNIEKRRLLSCEKLATTALTSPLLDSNLGTSQAFPESFLLRWPMEHRQTIISGTVIDWTTGKPVPDVQVWFKGMNGTSKATRTDGQGRFTTFVQQWEIATLFASDERLGPFPFARSCPGSLSKVLAVRLALDGGFHCDFLSPGAYKLHVRLDPYWATPLQEADTESLVKANDHNQPELLVELREAAEKPLPQPSPLPASESGWLQVRRVCPPDLGDGISAYVQAWGPTKPNLRSFHRSCTEEQTWPVVPGTYTISAYRIDFFEKRKQSEVTFCFAGMEPG